MGNKKNEDNFLSYLPSLKKLHIVFLLYAIQISLFLLVMIFFWLVSSQVFYGAILGQTIVSTLLVFHFIFLANNSEKIRQKYRKKYKNLTGQYFWFNYQSYTIPVISAAYYFPLLLKTDYFLPAFFKVPSHFLTDTLFPIYVALPLGFIVLIIGLFMRRKSGGYGPDEDNYMTYIYPEKSKLITTGMYRFIRNPQYVSRGVISVSFGILANNLGAILVGLIHFISYCAIIPAEDKELTRRFSKDFILYKKKVPALFPKFGNWKKFIKYVFVR